MRRIQIHHKLKRLKHFLVRNQVIQINSLGGTITNMAVQRPVAVIDHILKFTEGTHFCRIYKLSV